MARIISLFLRTQQRITTITSSVSRARPPSLSICPLHLSAISPHLNADSLASRICFDPDLIKSNGTVDIRIDHCPSHAVHRLNLAVWVCGVRVVDDGVVLSDLGAVVRPAHELGGVEMNVWVGVFPSGCKEDTQDV